MCFVIDQSVMSGILLFTLAYSSRNIPLNISLYILRSFSSLQGQNYRRISHSRAQMSPTSGDETDMILIKEHVTPCHPLVFFLF